MGGDAVQAHVSFGEGVLDFFGAFESFFGLQHVVGRLRASRARFPGVIEELGQALGAMLCAFDAGMEAGCRHKLWLLVLAVRITEVRFGNQS